jgi:D-alanine-D-alanine ligase
MKKINKHIEIVSSSIAALSWMSESSRLAMQESLAKSYKTVGITIVDNQSDLEALIQKNPDIVFLGMSNIPRKATAAKSSPCIWLADALNKNDILYTGSTADAMMLEDDKLKAKKVIKKAGLSTAPFFMAYTGQFTSESQLVLPFPLFIKPPKLGAGIGIDKLSVARDYRQYKSKIAKLDKEFDSESLVEEYLTGREFTVAILKNTHDDGYKVMPLELHAPVNSNGDAIIDFETKISDTETYSKIDDESIKTSISSLALECFKTLGAKDYGRIDIRCNESGTPYFLEANLIPSTVEGYGNFHNACNLVANLSYDDMLLQIVQLGFEGHIPYVAPVIEVKDEAPVAVAAK